MKSTIAKGPNILNLNAYTQGEEDNQQYQYDQEDNSQRPPIDSKNIEDQFDNFLKQLNKYDQILNNVAHNIDELASSNEYFITDFYPPFIINTTYQNDQEKKIVANSDPQLVKILFNLEKTNKVYKQQMKGWIFEFAKKTQLSETLLQENQILRKAICTKNKEIVKLVQTISHTENDHILELKQNFQILKEENGLLLDHLSKMSQQLIQKKQDSKRLNNALQESRKSLLQVEKQSRQVQDNEEHLSKTVALVQESLNQIQKRKKKLQKERNRLIQLKRDYTHDESSIQSRVESFQNDKFSIQKQLKVKFQTHQTEKNDLIEKIDELTEKVQKQKQDTRFVEGQIQRNQNRLQQFNKINKQLKTKNQSNYDVLEKIKKQFAKIIDSQSTISSQIDLLTTDIDSLKEQLKSFDEIQRQTQLRHKSELKHLEQSNNKLIAQNRVKQTKATKQLVKKVYEEKLELSVKDKEIIEWEGKIFNKKEEITDLKNQMKQIRNNQTKVTDLRNKLRGYETSRNY